MSVPEWAVLLPTGAVTREFGRFVADGGHVTDDAAIFRNVSGEPAYAIAFGVSGDSPFVMTVVVTGVLPEPFTPSGGDFGCDLGLLFE